MREILFRGQTRRYGEKVSVPSGDKVPGNWVYGGLCRLKSSDGRAIIYQRDPELDEFPVYADTVGQYIGRNDVDEKRIFEGDIVNALIKYAPEHSGAEICVVFWDGERSGFRLRNRLGRVFDMALFDELKIIGNVYDDPL